MVPLNYSFLVISVYMIILANDNLFKILKF